MKGAPYGRMPWQQSRLRRIDYVISAEDGVSPSPLSSYKLWDSRRPTACWPGSMYSKHGLNPRAGEKHESDL